MAINNGLFFEAARAITPELIEELDDHGPDHVEDGGLLYLCNEKIHSILHSASEIMRWGSLINCSGEAAETAHKINVKGPGSNVNQRDSALGTLMTHARRKRNGTSLGKRYPR